MGTVQIQRLKQLEEENAKLKWLVADLSVRAFLHRALNALPSITWRMPRRTEWSFTDPAHEVVRRLAAAATEVRRTAPALNMRVSGSDGRLLRTDGLPTVLYGPMPFGLGKNEHELVDELAVVAEVYALTAWDLLGG